MKWRLIFAANVLVPLMFVAVGSTAGLRGAMAAWAMAFGFGYFVGVRAESDESNEK